MSNISSKPSQRLLALDILRGITVAGMILVNNAGSWSAPYSPLRHASWNGLTPTDLVFPFFMFIMGISTYMSLRKCDFRLTAETGLHIVRRAAVIFGLGIVLGWLGSVLYAWLLNDVDFVTAATQWENLRLLGVLQRLALSYGIAALIALTVRHKWLPWISGGLLVVYAGILIAGNGFAPDDSNIIGIIDRAVIGPAHMYVDYPMGDPLILDPEGLIGTIPSVAHVLIGFMCGALLCGGGSIDRKMVNLFLVGTILMFTGLLLSYGLPLNKKIWSPTYVLTTCGMAASLLAVLIWVIDVKGWRRWTGFFRAFGLNPLYLYVQSIVLHYVFSVIQVHTSLADGGVTSLKGWFRLAVLDPLAGDNMQLESLTWGLLFVLLNWLPGYWLARRGKIIKI